MQVGVGKACLIVLLLLFVSILEGVVVDLWDEIERGKRGDKTDNHVSVTIFHPSETLDTAAEAFRSLLCFLKAEAEGG